MAQTGTAVALDRPRAGRIARADDGAAPGTERALSPRHEPAVDQEQQARTAARERHPLLLRPRGSRRADVRRALAQARRRAPDPAEARQLQIASLRLDTPRLRTSPEATHHRSAACRRPTLLGAAGCLFRFLALRYVRLVGAKPWFTQFIVRDERTLRGRFVEIVFPVGLDVDAQSFAELWDVLRGATVRWSVGSTRSADPASS